MEKNMFVIFWGNWKNNLKSQLWDFIFQKNFYIFQKSRIMLAWKNYFYFVFSSVRFSFCLGFSFLLRREGWCMKIFPMFLLVNMGFFSGRVREPMGKIRFFSHVSRQRECSMNRGKSNISSFLATIPPRLTMSLRICVVLFWRLVSLKMRL